MQFNIYILIFIFIQNSLFGAMSSNEFNREQESEKAKILNQNNNLFKEKDKTDKNDFSKNLSFNKFRDPVNDKHDELNSFIFKDVNLFETLNKNYRLFKEKNKEHIEKFHKNLSLNKFQDLSKNNKYDKEKKILIKIIKFENIDEDDLKNIKNLTWKKKIKVGYFSSNSNKLLKEFNENYKKNILHNFKILIDKRNNELTLLDNNELLSKDIKNDIIALTKFNIINHIDKIELYKDCFILIDNDLYVVNLLNDNVDEIGPTENELKEEIKEKNERYYKELGNKYLRDRYNFDNILKQYNIEEESIKLYFKHNIEDFIQNTIFENRLKFPQFQFISTIIEEIENNEKIKSANKLSENFYLILFHEITHYLFEFLNKSEFLNKNNKQFINKNLNFNGYIFLNDNEIYINKNQMGIYVSNIEVLHNDNFFFYNKLFIWKYL